jgi:hypothetical protein
MGRRAMPSFETPHSAAPQDEVLPGKSCRARHFAPGFRCAAHA